MQPHRSHAIACNLSAAMNGLLGYRSVACRIAFLCAVSIIASAHAAGAAGVVGTGTAVSCTDVALNAALAGGGLVTFNCGGAATIEIDRFTGAKAINVDTIVDGGGLINLSRRSDSSLFEVGQAVFTVRDVAIDGPGGFNALSAIVVFSGGEVIVVHSTFSGNSAPAGGAILNLGTLTVTSSTFSGNSALAGGAILNQGILAIADSTFVGNRNLPCLDCSSEGGAIYNSGSLTVTNSTFSGNISFRPGGAISNHGTLAVTNSTFFGNRDAISNAGSLTVTNSSFFDNNGAIYNSAVCGEFGNDPCSATLTNTIIASSSPGDNCVGIITGGGHNLDDGTSCGFSLANGSLSNTDPLLDPAGLEDNGGPTQTIALLDHSPAIDAGDPEICANPPVNGVDQRGYARPGAGHTRCSIGAYEADTDVIPAELCMGDCDGTDSVTVNEVITLVSIALGEAEPSTCAQGVPSGTEVDVALITQAVISALYGCSG